jgi:hypothetical protein
MIFWMQKIIIINYHLLWINDNSICKNLSNSNNDLYCAYQRVNLVISKGLCHWTIRKIRLFTGIIYAIVPTVSTVTLCHRTQLHCITRLARGILLECTTVIALQWQLVWHVQLNNIIVHVPARNATQRTIFTHLINANPQNMHYLYSHLINMNNNTPT